MDRFNCSKQRYDILVLLQLRRISSFHFSATGPSTGYSSSELQRLLVYDRKGRPQGLAMDALSVGWLSGSLPLMTGIHRLLRLFRDQPYVKREGHLVPIGLEATIEVEETRYLRWLSPHETWRFRDAETGEILSGGVISEMVSSQELASWTLMSGSREVSELPGLQLVAITPFPSETAGWHH